MVCIKGVVFFVLVLVSVMLVSLFCVMCFTRVVFAFESYIVLIKCVVGLLIGFMRMIFVGEMYNNCDFNLGCCMVFMNFLFSMFLVFVLIVVNFTRVDVDVDVSFATRFSAMYNK